MHVLAVAHALLTLAALMAQTHAQTTWSRLGPSANVNGLVTVGLANTNGTASWSAPIPNVASFAGVSLYHQAAVFSPGANPAGLVFSNAGTLTLGAR